MRSPAEAQRRYDELMIEQKAKKLDRLLKAERGLQALIDARQPVAGGYAAAKEELAAATQALFHPDPAQRRPLTLDEDRRISWFASHAPKPEGAG